MLRPALNEKSRACVCLYSICNFSMGGGPDLQNWLRHSLGYSYVQDHRSPIGCYRPIGVSLSSALRSRLLKHCRLTENEWLPSRPQHLPVAPHAAPGIPVTSRDLQHDRVDDPMDDDGEYELDPRHLDADFSAIASGGYGCVVAPRAQREAERDAFPDHARAAHWLCIGDTNSRFPGRSICARVPTAALEL